MPVPLQRSNFRCPPDGSKLPQATASMSAGVAAMGGAPSPGKYHAEFPTRQRKRLQVGTTNLSKSNSVAEANKSGSPGSAETNISAAVDRIGETNVTAMKATLESPQRRSSTNYRSNASGKVIPLVLRTEIRRLSGLSPTSTSRSTDEWCDGSSMPKQSFKNGTVETKELPGLQIGSIGNNNSQENGISGRSSSGHFDEGSDTSKTCRAANKEKAALARNRAKLYDVFMEKYGSMRAVFRAFDNDGNGMISAQRFHDMVEAAEVDFTPDETRALYRTADINGDNTVAFHEFIQMFSLSTAEPTVSAFSPVKDLSELTRDPTSSLTIKYRTPLELSQHSRRRMKQLRKQVTDKLRQKHGLAIGVRGGKPEQLLAYAFKNVDSDNDGFLSYSEVEHALGRGFLQMEDTIPEAEMREMLQLMDRNRDQQISLREFVHYFAVGEREVATDLIDNARTKELAALHAKRTLELTPRDVVDPLFAQRKSTMHQQEEPSPRNTEVAPGTCLPEALSKRTAAIIYGGGGVAFSSPKSSGDFTNVDRENKVALPTSSFSGQPEIDHRPATSCGTGSPTVAVLSPVSSDRFYHRRRERTDWTRVGVGGNGIGSDTGLYQSPHERFITTTGEGYSPLYRAPPSAKGDSDDSFLMMRAGKPSSTIEEDARRARRAARYDRTQALLQEFEEAHTREERLRDWKSRGNVRKVAGERFCYLDRLQDREHRVASREDRMQRRHGGASFLKMWAGSADSQFNQP
ncbi:unnamed protein product [Phytophthora fragariaefolia]|uniref:Unnamed protein product n=1 Tax=Phytophthora fragariaefolia TaxID=1490495 RepID=A0A9W7CRM6_9STRA|nr:unnamed protein product [Phytophthora fragariaefolia]